MGREQEDAGFLWDMLDAAQAVREFVAGCSFDDYAADRKLRGAVERHIEIIGEAAGKVSRAFREAHPEIPWKQIIAQRHVLAHEYGEIEDPLLWRVATRHIPDLIVTLGPLVPPTLGETDG
jgi:uncharacterized protein with HEPN domain